MLSDVERGSLRDEHALSSFRYLLQNLTPLELGIKVRIQILRWQSSGIMEGVLRW